jgi:chromosome segregation ATPase
VSSLNSEISRGVQDVANLEQEKRDLEARIEQYEREITAREANNKEYEQQIRAANRVDGEITELKSHAESTAGQVSDDNRQLLKLKQALDQCNALIKAQSLEVESSASFAERFAGMFLGRRIAHAVKRPRQFRRQREFMEQACQVLEQIHSDVPLLLPSMQMKLLDLNSWNGSESSAADLGQSMPAISYFAE